MATAVKYHERLCRYPVRRILAGVNLAIDSNTTDFVPSVGRIMSLIQAQQFDDKVKLLSEPRPSAKELAAVRTTLSGLIERFKGADSEIRAARIAARRAELKAQAEMLMSKTGEDDK